MKRIIEALTHQNIVVSSEWTKKLLPTLAEKLEEAMEKNAVSGLDHHNEIRQQQWKQNGYYIEIGIHEQSFENYELEFYVTPFGLEETFSGPPWITISTSRYLQEENDETEKILAFMVKRLVG
ncbi:hypothetical protein AWH56_012600 [Anaerobacillus isosaccharinicus]|uniref:Uncharacterized protein n=1 Tax=Anaerobacillus isosaccharinicus TaxID=1532552 RepID=A0A1S2MG04_9BACI|nr:hypothetical protein [Anaerobacillus isosaccharinicus]MBA5588262.1 hypothetical protein [Anaerobacillus isosaccharinicus]QOY38296.1 hypothetical protein AWH56_012600 [Anaerobacillus isosaccharinicus]